MLHKSVKPNKLVMGSPRAKYSDDIEMFSEHSLTKVTFSIETQSSLVFLGGRDNYEGPPGTSAHSYFPSACGGSDRLANLSCVSHSKLDNFSQIGENAIGFTIPYGGTVRFTVHRDEGVRYWVNGELLISEDDDV